MRPAALTSGSLRIALLLLPLTLATANAAPRNAEPRLNLVVHGLAGIVVWPDRVELLFPDIHEHVYKAGTWGKELRLKQGVTYGLTGVRSSAKLPAIDPHTNLVFRQVTDIKRGADKVFCAFSLPLPSAIVGLRSAPISPTRPPFAGPSANGVAVTALPLVHTLVYDVADLGQLGLTSIDWSPEVGKDRTVNLHVWAEPDVTLEHEADAHSSRAFDALMRLFPALDMTLSFGQAVEPDKVVRLKGLNTWEQRTLVERSKLLYPVETSRPKRKGSEVSNCIAVIIDNATP